MMSEDTNQSQQIQDITHQQQLQDITDQQQLQDITDQQNVKRKNQRISDERRQLITDAYDKGQSYGEISETFKVNPKTIQSIVKVYQKEGRSTK